MVLLLEWRTLLTCLMKPAGTYLLKCKAVNIVYITSYLPTPSITRSYVNEGIHLYSHIVYIICLDFLLLTDVCSNIFKSCLLYMNYRFLDFLDSVMCFVRFILYYVGCMFVAALLNHFWFISQQNLGKRSFSVRYYLKANKPMSVCRCQPAVRIIVSPRSVIAGYDIRIWIGLVVELGLVKLLQSSFVDLVR